MACGSRISSMARKPDLAFAFMAATAFVALATCGRTELDPVLAGGAGGQIAGTGGSGGGSAGRSGSGAASGTGGTGAAGPMFGTGGALPGGATGGRPGSGGGSLGTGGGSGGRGAAPGTGGITGGGAPGATGGLSGGGTSGSGGNGIPASTPGLVPCGDQSCTAELEMCCLGASSGGAGSRCVRAGNPCPGAALACDEPADCTTGVCCGSVMVPTSPSTPTLLSGCVPRGTCAPAPFRFVFCRRNSDCGPDAPVCCSVQGLTVCQTRCN